jgi:serine/threonine-protein kinase
VEPPLTDRGSIVGTLHYMAPEQLSGEEADARTDIFAFGAVMYEMVTGRKAFDGKSQASVIAAILDHEPAPVSTLQPTSPAALDHLIRTCLAKEPDRRWQSAGDLGRHLTWLLAEGSSPNSTIAMSARPTRPSARRMLPLAAAAAGALLVALATRYLTRLPAPPPIIRLDYQLPQDHEIRNADRPVLAFSADGSHFVYNTTKGLYLRSLRESEARLIPGTEEDLSNPFLSPDGQWVGYFAGGQLKKIPTSGGAATRLCEAEPAFGASWVTDGTIVFGQPRGIMRVPAGGGTPTVIVPAQAGELLDGPQLLGGGRHVLVTVARGSDNTRWDDALIVAHDVASGQRNVLWTGGSAARYVSTGHLVYAARDTLFALPFDVDGLTVSGRPLALVAGVHRSLKPSQHAGFASYALSDDGTLVYLRAEDVARSRILGFADRQGGVQELGVPPGPYVNPRLSQDGRRLLVQTLDEQGRGDIWVWDLSGRSQIRQLTMGGHSRYPLWTPDSARVTFVSDRDGTPAIYSQRIDGQAPERLALLGDYGRPDSWSPDGSTLAYRSARRNESTAIWTLEPGAGRQPALFYDLPDSDQYESAFSPDGRWLAYTSTETGADEVFVQPFPATGAKVRVTQRGGNFPVWSPDGKGLFYRRSFDKDLNRSHGARLFAVDVTTNGGFEFGPERELPMKGFLVFNTYRDYDVAQDNKRFLMVFPAGGPPGLPRISVVQNWFEELKTRVPVH